MHTFTLLDADGQAHTYEFTLHKATEGQRIMFKLYALAAGPLAGALGGLLKAGSISEVVSGDTVADLDLVKVGDALRAALADMPGLTREILRNTMRDGQRLSDDHAFDVAYRGNYWELNLALWEVVSANRFLPLSAISALVAKAKAEKARKEAEAKAKAEAAAPSP